MAITAQDVNKLRKITGAGMMDCKKALTECEGDFDKAIEELRKKGQKVAQKRSDREASEGIVIGGTNSENNYGVIISMNCETDFVAKNDDFLKNATNVFNVVLNKKPKDITELKSLTIEDKTISELLLELTGKIGEKIEISNFETVSDEYVISYNHHNNKLSCLVSYNKTIPTEVADNIAMQIAAMNPICVDREGMDKKTLENEKRIAIETLKNEGKPEDKIEMIANGKLNKFISENTLLNQKFFQDDKKSVKQYLKDIDKKVSVNSFKRVSLS